LDRIYTGDEKLCMTINATQKNLKKVKWKWSSRVIKPEMKEDSFVRLVRLQDCILYFELLLKYQTNNADKYCQQFDNLHETIQEKRPSLIN